MSFGLSGQIDRNVMIGGDVVVAWIDHETLNGYAYDYYLDAKSQCAGNRGSCPDVKLSVRRKQRPLKIDYLWVDEQMTNCCGIL